MSNHPTPDALEKRLVATTAVDSITLAIANAELARDAIAAYRWALGERDYWMAADGQTTEDLRVAERERDEARARSNVARAEVERLRDERRVEARIVHDEVVRLKRERDEANQDADEATDRCNATIDSNDNLRAEVERLRDALRDSERERDEARGERFHTQYAYKLERDESKRLRAALLEARNRLGPEQIGARKVIARALDGAQ